MLINKALQDEGYIFPRSVNPNYLITLIQLGKKPFVKATYYRNHKGIVWCSVLSIGWIKRNFLDLEPCTIHDIKIILKEHVHLTNTCLLLGIPEL